MDDSYPYVDCLPQIFIVCTRSSMQSHKNIRGFLDLLNSLDIKTFLSFTTNHTCENPVHGPDEDLSIEDELAARIGVRADRKDIHHAALSARSSRSEVLLCAKIY